VSAWLIAGAAALLSLERITYVVVWRHPGRFRAWAGRPWVARLGGPVDVLAALFAGFKAVQGLVFLTWHLALGDGALSPQSTEAPVIAAGVVLIAAGQALNVSVFRRLGKTGVFYGCRLGYRVSWCRSFPFTWFEHPQYVGTVLAIWGLFVLMRFPAPDWFFIPALETVYYAIGARLERDPT
jgi:methylene-fatty-acyl-phospholipid synthase